MEIMTGGILRGWSKYHPQHHLASRNDCDTRKINVCHMIELSMTYGLGGSMSLLTWYNKEIAKSCPMAFEQLLNVTFLGTGQCPCIPFLVRKLRFREKHTLFDLGCG